MLISLNLEDVVGHPFGVAVGLPLRLPDTPEDVDEAVFGDRSSNL